MLTNPTQNQVVKKLNEIDSSYLDKSNIDSALSETSENPVQNKVINSKINDIITTNQQITGELSTTFDGDNATAWHAGGSKTTGNWSITLGADAEAHQLSIAIGNQAKAFGGSDTMIGSYAQRNDLTTSSGAKSSGVAIGNHASIAGDHAVAIGAGAKIQLETKGDDTIQLGNGTNTEAGTFKVRDYTLLDANGKIPSERLPESSGDYVQYIEQTLTEDQQLQARTNISAQKDLGLKYSNFVSTPNEDDPSIGVDQFTYNENSSIAIGAGISVQSTGGTNLTVDKDNFLSYSSSIDDSGAAKSYSAIQQDNSSFTCVVVNDADTASATKTNSFTLTAESSTLELNRMDYGHSLISCGLDTSDNKVKVNARADSSDSTSIIEVSDNSISLNVGVEQSSIKNSLKLTENSATLNGKKLLTEDYIGTTSGKIPTLDSDGKLSEDVIPRVAITDTFVVNSEAEMLALSTAEVGDIAIRTDISETFILQAEPYSTLNNWKQILSPTAGVTSVNGKTGSVTITATDIGALTTADIVDNLTTEDATKPLSANQGKVLNDKNSATNQQLVLVKSSITTINNNITTNTEDIATNSQKITNLENNKADKTEIPTIDAALSTTSENPVQNKVIASVLEAYLQVPDQTKLSTELLTKNATFTPTSNGYILCTATASDHNNAWFRIRYGDVTGQILCGLMGAKGTSLGYNNMPSMICPVKKNETYYLETSTNYYDLRFMEA